MKHAGQEALAILEPVLRQLREHDALVERTPGSFYLRSRVAFLHFHEDSSGLFADVKEDLLKFTRYRVTTRTEQKDFLSRVTRCLSMRGAGNARKGN